MANDISLMTVKQWKKQMSLTFSAEGRGEAPNAAGEGTEAVRAGYDTESQASPENLMEEVCQRDNLVKALKRVKANQGSPGIDGMKGWTISRPTGRKSGSNCCRAPTNRRR